MTEQYFDLKFLDTDNSFQNEILDRAKKQLDYTETLQQASEIMNQIGSNCSAIELQLNQMKTLLAGVDKANTVGEQIEKFGHMMKTIGTQFMSQARFSLQALQSVVFPTIKKFSEEFVDANNSFETSLEALGQLTNKSNREDYMQAESSFVKAATKKSGLLFSLNNQVQIAENTLYSSIMLSMTQFLVLVGDLMGEYIISNKTIFDDLKNSSNDYYRAIKNWLSKDLNQDPANNSATAAAAQYWDLRFISNSKVINNLSQPNHTVWLREPHPLRSTTWQRGKMTFEDSLLKFERPGEDGSTVVKQWVLPLVTVSKREEGRRFAIKVQGPTEIIEFQTLSKHDMNEWMQLFTNHNLNVLGENKQTTSKFACVDCGCPDATWVSVNWAAPLCLKCSGFHRQMSSTNSKVRSFTLDKMNPLTIHMIEELQGECNKILLAKNPGVKITSNSDEKEREQYITRKYINNEWCIQEAIPDPFKAIQERDLKALFYAAHFGRIDETRESLTPLHAACAVGWDDGVALLAYCVNDLNVKDNSGWTPLCYAVFYQHVDIIDFLLSVGASAKNLAINIYQLSIATKNMKVAKLIMTHADQVRNNEIEFKPCSYCFAPPGTPENYTIILKSRI